jgi:hypothetical protein
VGSARAVAAQWVSAHAAADPRFRGAFFSGSTTRMPDDAVLPRTSDVDVVVVTAGRDAAPKLGKLLVGGVLLEVTHLSFDEVASAGQVLSSYHLAGSFRTDTIIADPTGHLRRLHTAVASAFAEPAWVRRRCAGVRHRIENGLAAVDPAAPFHERVNGWLFPTGVTTHLPLVAALRNPTVRLRYPAARTVLVDHGRADVYRELLGLLGCPDLSADAVRRHLDALADTFDRTAAAARTRFFFSSDITPAARPIAIDGSRALIDAGDHREAMFWIVATYARCHTILAADDPALHRELDLAFRAAVADLGITSGADLRRRGDEVLAYLPDLWQASEAMIG